MPSSSNFREPNFFYQEFPSEVFTREELSVLEDLAHNRLRKIVGLDNEKDKQQEMFEKVKNNILPNKKNALKEWSISARALRNVIDSALRGDYRYDYKFGTVYSSAYRLCRIWNCKTNNVICTVKTTNNKFIIRYRHNSYYASVMASYNNTETQEIYSRQTKKVIAIESKNLHLHRNGAANRADASMEAQLGFRLARLNKFIKDKLAKEQKPC